MAVRMPPCSVELSGSMCAMTSLKVTCAEVGQEQEDAEEEAEVADAVDDEGFPAGVGGRIAPLK